MTPELVTVNDDDALAHAVQRMVQRGLKRLPVLDSRGRLAGMLSRLDVLGAVGSGSNPPAQQARRQGRTVGEVMDRRVPTVLADADLVDAVERLVSAALKRVAVVDEAGRLLGVITDGDLVARVRPEARSGLLAALTGRGRAPDVPVTAREVMSTTALSGPPETTIGEGIERMLADGRKRFFVVDAGRRLLGAVDRQALLLAVAGIEPQSRGRH